MPFFFRDHKLTAKQNNILLTFYETGPYFMKFHAIHN